MITVGYSTRKKNEEFKNYLIKSSGFKKLNVIEKINNGEKSLSEVYNEIIDECETDILVLCHDDIYFDATGWYSKLLKHFDKSDYGIIGVAGSTEMPKSGKWWENRKSMIGIVNHESGGKKWESKYSSSQGNEIRETLIVDGLFIVLHKKRIKKNFNNEVKGFHFYDIDFSFQNHLEGVKVGVITNIRITHKSIGQTNEQWEENRILFSEKFLNFLPKKLPFDEKYKIKVLLSCLFFKTFTGSELYVFELAKNLINLNCDVTVMSDIGGPLTDMAKRLGIKVIPHDSPPGYKMGDGVWGFNTPNGIQTSVKGALYQVSLADFDIIHIQHKPVAERILQLYPNIPKIYTIHSEIISLEDPVKHESIKKYIAIRPEIKEHIVNNFEILDSEVEVIYNPVDEEKFKKTTDKSENYVLFVGTIDYLRQETILDLVNYSRDINKELWIVGENKSNYLQEILVNSHVKHFSPTWKIEPFINRCYETAGIQLGRTTIEGWMGGKDSWIYNVDSSGTIIKKEKFSPPNDIQKYYSSNVCNQIKKEYLKILNA
jgi:glycosyltransferase involved in cell wall biosynthesis